MILLYGIIIAIPTIIIAGSIYTMFAKKLVPSAFEKGLEGSIAKLGDAKQYKLEDTPAFGVSTFTALFPDILMGIPTIVNLIQTSMGLETNLFFAIVETLGKPSMVSFCPYC